ncbi:hypothetical protein A0J61_03526 [Choanephora cucurbitarum]|uniref:BLOC-1-related complex subunit 7 n=1 Tax=Choanephora cucurbitarum TaxID=101091 RepID=A0A1C7NI25_9FUNG|nr:hypothetical protein A0J61_03526 [Choanephora cucurbitarum]
MQNHQELSKEECRAKTEKVYDDWEQLIKASIKASEIHEQTLKTASMFTRVDLYQKSTEHRLEKAYKSLIQLVA